MFKSKIPFMNWNGQNHIVIHYSVLFVAHEEWNALNLKDKGQVFKTNSYNSSSNND